MPKITIKSASVKEIEFEESILLSQAVLQSGFMLDMPCAGNHTCGKCRVSVSGAISPMGAEEKRLLGESRDNTRLACMAFAVGDAEITLSGSVDHGDILSNGRLPNIAVDKAEENDFGIAVDIGTTTIVSYLCRLQSGELVNNICELNRQRQYGADVISRIAYCDEHSVAQPQKTIISQLSEMFGQNISQAGIAASDIKKLTITGNTTMLHLLAGINPSSLARVPFDVPCYFGLEKPADELFEMFDSNTVLYLPYCISAYIGADIVSAITAAEVCEDSRRTLLLDIGTNGEMALWNNGRITGCACAAGPAFEGAQIELGMTATAGAISKVLLADGKVSWRTIANAKPTGLCGTGIISTVSLMKDIGVLDEGGAILEDDHDWPHLISEIDGQPVFMIGESGVYLTQRDVRNVQLAKSAIAAGIDTLLYDQELLEEEIERFVLCGGFGSYIDPYEAANIGLLPQSLIGRIEVHGNAAGSGAVAAMLSSGLRQKSERIAKEAREVSLSQSPFFMDRYIERMMF